MILEEHLLDLLKELINIGTGEAALSLNQITKSHIELDPPQVHVVKRSDLKEKIQSFVGEEVSIVEMYFDGPISGGSFHIMGKKDLGTLVHFFLDSDDDSVLNAENIRIDVHKEVSNILINSIMCKFTDKLDDVLKLTPPEYLELNNFVQSVDTHFSTDDGFQLIFSKIQFQTEGEDLTGIIVLIFKVDELVGLLKEVKDRWVNNE